MKINISSLKLERKPNLVALEQSLSAGYIFGELIGGDQSQHGADPWHEIPVHVRTHTSSYTINNFNKLHDIHMIKE